MTLDVNIILGILIISVTLIDIVTDDWELNFECMREHL